MSGRIAGLREHAGKIHGPATWPAIIDRVTWERVRTTLEARPGYRARRQYLLSGVATCAECDTPLLGHTRYSRRREPIATYACVKARGGCGGVYATAAPIETQVSARMSDSIRSGDMRRRLTSTSPAGPSESELVERIDAEEAKLAAYAAMLDSGQLEAVEWQTMRSGVLGRLDQLRAQLSVDGHVEALQRLAETPWDELTIDQQRVLVDAALTVQVRRVLRGGPRFDPGRLSIEWRG